MTSLEKLVLTIVQTNPNRLITHGSVFPNQQIQADDIIDVSVVKRQHSHDVHFTFNERSKRIQMLAEEIGCNTDRHYLRVRSLSDQIMFACTPIGFAEFSDFNEYVLRLANRFMEIDVQTINEIGINLALMGKMTSEISDLIEMYTM